MRGLSLMRVPSNILGIAVILSALLLGVGGASAAGTGDLAPKPAKAEKGEQCVEPVDDMRRYHMNYLKHQRDETLREGIRGNKYSLNECIDCHAAKSPDVAGGNVRSIKPFCTECHQFAAVKIDCFECHTGIAGPVIKGNKPPMPKEHGKTDQEKDALVFGMLENYLKSKSETGGDAK